MSDYLLRDLSEDFWEKVKHKAIDEHRPVRAVVINLLEQWVGYDQFGDPLPRSDKKKGR